MAAVIQSPAQIYKPCGFNTNGATKEYCKTVSSVPARQRQGCATCECPWKAKGIASVQKTAALVQAPKSIVRSAPSGAGQQVRATTTLIPKKNLPMPVEAGDDKPVWRAILDRIKKALAEGVLVKLECNSIRPLPGQPRDYFDPSGMDKLEKSIREVGQIQCGLVRRVPEDALITHELLDGERRWRVCSRISTVQYRAIEVDIDDEAAPFIVAAIANFNRADHTPLEIAMAIEKLHQRLGAPMPVVAEMLGFTVHWAYQMHGLLNLSQSVKDMLDPNLVEKDKDLLPVSAAIHISKLNPELQIGIARRFASGEISMRQLRREVVRVGEEHGMPVRTRAQEPRKQMEMLVNLAKNLSVLAHDLRMFVDRGDFGEFIRGRDQEKVTRMQRALVSAGDAIEISKCKIASALTPQT